jgi:hypothetical protein
VNEQAFRSCPHVNTIFTSVKPLISAFPWRFTLQESCVLVEYPLSFYYPVVHVKALAIKIPATVDVLAVIC